MKEYLNKIFSKIKIGYLWYLLVLVLAIFVGVFLSYKRNITSTNSKAFIPDTTIVPTVGTYAFQNLTNNFQTQFKTNPTATDSVVFSNNSGKISFHTPTKQSFGIISFSQTATSEGSILTYPEIFPQIDLRYTVSSSRLLEEFIIKDASTAQKIDRIDQAAKTQNTWKKNQDGSITFINNDKPAFTLPAPVMYEVGNRSASSNGITYEIKNNQDNLIISKVLTKQGRAWLADKKRIYPIAIDLVIDNADSSDPSTLVIDNGDSVNSWTSSDNTNTPISQETNIKQEGTGSVKIQTTTGAATLNLDLMEYTSNANAQSAYVTNALTANATGGTITTSGLSTIHTFTTNGTFRIPTTNSVSYLIVAGGGSGGSDQGGGGGAGGMLTGSTSLTGNTDYPIVVGAGGIAVVAASGHGNNGSDSTFAGLTAIGGGGGAGCTGAAASLGGSGGGGGCAQAVGAGTAGQGNSGGAYGSNSGGGGGGKTSAGVAANAAANTGGNGGAGQASSITGASVTYAGGGGGGGTSGVGTGGTGGGGNGALNTASAGNGTANTGGGGGGRRYGGSGGAGGSGIVVVSYLTPPYLQSYSENTIKTEGSYSLKVIANATSSLNKTLTKTISSPLNLSNINSVSFDIRSNRTGNNIKVGLHDTGGTTTEITPNITNANAFQTVTIDLSGVSNANKDVIDQVIITIVNADADNTFYIDNMLLQINDRSIYDIITKTASPTSLANAATITFWVRSSMTGTYATFGFGESAATEQTTSITINQADTWEQKTWDISGITSSAKDNVTKFAFTLTDFTTGGAVYFDNINANGYSNTWISSDPTSTSVSAESTIKQEGTGSIKIQTSNDNNYISTLDLMEYSSDGNAQAGYVTNSLVSNATGGTITSAGGYTIHSFTSSGTFAISGDANLDLLVVAGGGGGATATGGFNAPGGGGGAGGVVSTTTSVTSGSTNVVVGNGGPIETNGSNSSFGNTIAIGGGKGAGYSTGAAGAGGSGGGGGNYSFAGGAGTAGQGNAGGTNPNNGTGGSGGGGAGAIGGASCAASPRCGGNGGNGVASSITGSSVTYGGGGGGGGWNNNGNNYGLGGTGGGGRGGLWTNTVPAIAGTPNTGGGGGGGGTISTGEYTVGAAGGSGIVIARYLTPPYLQSFSEGTIKTQGTYSLKAVANQTTSLNKSLTKTFGSPQDLSNRISVTFDIRASRTGSNIKVGLHDTGGTTTEVTPNVVSANVFQSATIDLSGVSNANKDAIDKIIITVVNADSANTFYIDNMVSNNQILSIGDTVTRTSPQTDLSTAANLTFWVRSSIAGSFATFGFGESAATEQTTSITINQANTWEQKSWDISGISGAARDAVTKFAFTFTGNTSGAAFYFDDIQTNKLFAPTFGTSTTPSYNTIRWTFTDNSTEETGIKIYDTSDNLKATCVGSNLTYCDETGLSANTQYTRKVGLYNASFSNIGTATTSLYTAAGVPTAPVVSNRQSTTTDVNPSLGVNPANTLMAVYRETGSTCDGSGGVYILASSGGSNGSTPDWQTDATWGNKTMTGLNSETTYSFCVKAKNSDGLETAFSSVGVLTDLAGYIPISGDYVFTGTGATNSAYLINRYRNGSNSGRYIFGVDNGETPNTASFEVRSGILTINGTDTLVAGKLTLTGGSIAVASGGEIGTGQGIWIVDADSDGFSADGKLYVGAQPTGGRRKSFASTLGTLDCNDAAYDLSNSTLSNQYIDNDGDGYGVGNAVVMCPAAGYASVNGDCDDNDAANTAARTHYADVDGDGYGNPNATLVTCPTAGYVSNNLDCGPSDANAKPGSSYCSSTAFTNASGSQSYDWNCSASGGSGTTCGSTYYSSHTASYSTWILNTRCATRSQTFIDNPQACGVAGNLAGNYFSGGCDQCDCAPSGTLAGTAGNQACQ